MVKLYFLNGPRTGESKEIPASGVCIGRETDNDVQLLVGGVSRYHAKISLNPAGKWRVEDLGSTNGTKLNGNPLTMPALLKDGDLIVVGDQVLRFGEENAGTADKTAEVLEEQAQKKKKPQVIFHTSRPASAPAQSPASAESEPSDVTQRAVSPKKLVTISIPPAKTAPAPENTAAPSATPDINNLFSKKKAEKNVPERRFLRRGNILFTIGVIGIAVIFVSLFLLFDTASDKNTAPAVPVSLSDRNPFYLNYEKQIVSKDNVFRFALKIEDNSAVFMLDDLKHRRHFVRKFGEINKDYMKTLLSSIKETGFMKLEEEPPSPSADGVDETRSLTVSYGPYLNSITVRNNYPKSSFEAIEMAVDRFAEDYGLKTVSLSAVEMREEAEKAFLKAEDLFANYQARPDNLRNAILRYQIAVEFYEQFDPPPKELNLASRHLKEAEGILRKMIKDAETNINILFRRKQYAEAAQECRKLMEYLDPDSKPYQKARANKIKLETLASGKR